MSPAPNVDADVVIVGAGLSGMTAARTVLAAGLTPVVLEADERVGGRILTGEVLPGVTVDLGAQWIGDTHERMFALAADLGVETFAQYDEGETSYDLAGSGVLRENVFHARYGDELAELANVLRHLDELAAEVPADAPWLAPRAREWDAITAGAWYDAHGFSTAARLDHLRYCAGRADRGDPLGVDRHGHVLERLHGGRRRGGRARGVGGRRVPHLARFRPVHPRSPGEARRNPQVVSGSDANPRSVTFGL